MFADGLFEGGPFLPPMCTFDAHFIESYSIFTRDVCNLRGQWAESETTKLEMNITLNIQSI